MEAEPAPDDARDRAEAQEWALRRFAGIVPDDLGESLRIISLGGLTAPPGFESMWRSVPATYNDPMFATFLSPDIIELQAMIFMGNPFNKHEMTVLGDMMQALQDTFDGEDIGPLYWMHHTVAPEIRASRIASGVAAKELVQASLECGLEDATKVEAAGFRLALEVRMLLEKSYHMAETMVSYLTRLQDMQDKKTRLESLIDTTLWQFLNIRFREGVIPDMDLTIPPGMPSQLDGWQVCERLGSGTFGAVHIIRHPPTATRPNGETRVIRALDKRQVRSFMDLKCIRRAIQIMQTLSSERWEHPNIVKLFRVYHSASHLFLCVQYGGSLNLFRRLKQREQETDPVELSLTKVCSIISQAVTAMAHLHLGPAICHRDIKPENFTIHDDPNEPDVQLKLADFDLAATMSIECRSPCGSLPFTAPEVVLRSPYDGGAADIWSISVVLLEVLCCTRVLETALKLDVSLEGAGDRIQTAKKIKQHFDFDQGCADKILRVHGRPELSRLVPKLSHTFQRTFRVNPARRWDARQLRDAVRDLKPEDLPES